MLHLAREVVFVCLKKVYGGKNAAAHVPVGFVDAHQDLFIARPPLPEPLRRSRFRCQHAHKLTSTRAQTSAGSVCCSGGLRSYPLKRISNVRIQATRRRREREKKNHRALKKVKMGQESRTASKGSWRTMEHDARRCTCEPCHAALHE